MRTEHLINANVHRIKEGARVLEDIARFILRDEVLFKSIRNLRHALENKKPIQDAEEDLGGEKLKEENTRHNLIHIVQANASRIQEALRVLEEINQNLSEKQKIKSLRYKAYHLHQTIYKKAMVFLKQEKLKGLYLVIDPNIIALSIEKIVKVINKTSVTIVQLRDKVSNKNDFLKKAILLKQLLNPEKLFIVNDHFDVALDVADGIHLGLDDYPISRIRAMAPDHFIIGASCHNLAEAKNAENAGASYLSVGCLFPTASKVDTTSTSLNMLKKIVAQSNIPVAGIGGITPNNIDQVLSCDVDMVSLVSSVWQAEDPEKIINEFQGKFGFY